MSRDLLIELHNMMVAGHRELWTWLSESPLRNKRAWPGWELWEEYVEDLIADTSYLWLEVLYRNSCFSPRGSNYCFGCMWARAFGEKYKRYHDFKPKWCEEICLLKSPGDILCGSGGLYHEWSLNFYKDSSCYAARELSNLPTRGIYFLEEELGW